MKVKAPYRACFVALGFAVILAIGCNSYKARREMEEGQKLYRDANYLTAAEHFKAAVALDENLVAAKLSLATAYRAQYAYGADTPGNERFGQQAVDVYQKVLEKEPHNTVALKGVSCVAMDMKKFDQAADFRKRVLALNPADPESYFWVGVVDWGSVNEDLRTLKPKVGLGPDDAFRGDQNDKQVCEQIRGTDAARVTEGITMLQTAIDKRPDYDDAMDFLVFLFRQRADLQCGDLHAWDEYEHLADKWVDAAMAARRQRAQTAAKSSEKAPDNRKSDIVWSGCMQPNPMPQGEAPQKTQ